MTNNLQTLSPARFDKDYFSKYEGDELGVIGGFWSIGVWKKCCDIILMLLPVCYSQMYVKVLVICNEK